MSPIIVVIDRPKWGRGFLLNSRTNKMCCLGFCALKAGLDAKSIRGVALPDGLLARKFFNAFPSLAKPLSKKAIKMVTVVKYSQTYYHALVKINDTELLSNKEREAGIVAIGALCGVKFEFVD